MLNLTEEQMMRLEACKRAARSFFSTFPDTGDLQEAQRLLQIEMGNCAELARGGGAGMPASEPPRR